MRTLYVLIPYLLISCVCFGQTAGGIEQYHYVGNQDNTVIVPVVHFQSKKGWYGEARYNYDELNTFSVYGGKTFSWNRAVAFSVTPLLGVSVGQLHALSTGNNIDASYQNFFFSSQSQYTFSTRAREENYFFSWIEAGYQPSNWLYAGLTMQHTRVYKTPHLVEPGILLGFSFKRWSLPLYYFNPLKKDQFFIIGVNWEWVK